VKRRDKHFKRWVEEDRTLVLLQVENERELKALHRRIDAAGIIHNVAEEPDWAGGPQETALALYPHPPDLLTPFVGELKLL
jgi:peptidyl-tRNA hydrolase